MKVLFTADVCWQSVEERGGYPGTSLKLIVFDRGRGPEVIRTCRKKWWEELEELKVAFVPPEYHNNLEMLPYAQHVLKPLIG